MKPENAETAAHQLSTFGLLIYVVSIIHFIFFVLILRDVLPIIDTLNFILLGHAIRRHQSRCG